MLKIQYMSAMTRPTPPMIGRMTNGGLSMTSSPLNLESMRAGVATVIGVLDGDGSGEGEASGEGVVAAACKVKLAQGWLPGEGWGLGGGLGGGGGGGGGA